MKKRLYFPLLALLSFIGLASCGNNEISSSSLPTTSLSQSSESQNSESTPSSSTPEKEWKETLSDGDVRVTKVPEQVVIGIQQEFSIELSWTRKLTNVEATFSVSDDSLLSPSALSFNTTGTDGSFSTGGVVSISAKSLTKTGKVFLEVEISSPNSSSMGGTVVIELSLIDTPEVTYWTETLTFSLADDFQNEIEEGTTLYAQITDSDHIVGAANPNLEAGETASWFQIDLTPLLEEESLSITFKYAKGHEYRLFAYVSDDESGRVLNFYKINSARGQGSTAESGFPSYDRDTEILSYPYDNGSLTVELTSDKS